MEDKQMVHTKGLLIVMLQNESKCLLMFRNFQASVPINGSLKSTRIIYSRSISFVQNFATLCTERKAKSASKNVLLLNDTTLQFDNDLRCVLNWKFNVSFNDDPTTMKEKHEATKIIHPKPQIYLAFAACPHHWLSTVNTQQPVSLHNSKWVYNRKLNTPGRNKTIDGHHAEKYAKPFYSLQSKWILIMTDLWCFF